MREVIGGTGVVITVLAIGYVFWDTLKYFHKHLVLRGRIREVGTLLDRGWITPVDAKIRLKELETEVHDKYT